MVAGLDDEGKGAVFSYDPVGSYDRDEMKCAGSAASLIQPFLDNQIGRQHIQVRTIPWIRWVPFLVQKLVKELHVLAYA